MVEGVLYRDRLYHPAIDAVAKLRNTNGLSLFKYQNHLTVDMLARFEISQKIDTTLRDTKS